MNSIDKRASTILSQMKQRCYNPKDTSYKHYGGRGIKICSEWLKDSSTFFKWYDTHVIKGLTIDRINNNGNYEPSNCKFSTKSEQAKNKRFRPNYCSITKPPKPIRLKKPKKPKKPKYPWIISIGYCKQYDTLSVL